ncbi:Predicted dehydrogenase [Streptomyces sp. DvalAA-14]|uniref:Gfo/Idh/MocA family protein n=1 Tax=unclassified Streptomyces TaxID=2593676 RepID=UPI00081BC164|nr:MULTISPECIES: Gfo/Idh/MocA family oxidoreductase [unclassified Streptomyces]MYS18840.1 Gfo/Idh/MocA family oxidoreductase [Streptomyces sp. SID4948]SCD30257.1 Predicted dehydrogenase [Streptomyces sp. DvalAA-14]
MSTPDSTSPDSTTPGSTAPDSDTPDNGSPQGPDSGPGPVVPLRVGLVGYGPAGSFFHAPLITSTPGLALDTIVTGDQQRRQQARAEYPDVRFAAGADELWDRAGELDLIVLASPNRTHVPLATAALAAGLPVVVDKPLAGTAAEARELARLAATHDRLLTVFQNRRWDADFLTLQALIRQGALGDVQRFESRFERWRPQPKGGWRESGDPAEFGGLLYDLGSHLVDQALTLFGPAQRVYAEAAVRRPGAAADDDSFIALTHAGGVRSHLWMSATTARLGPRFRVLGSAAGYVTYGLDPQEPALRAGLRPGGGAAWGVEPESAWGTLGTGDDVRPVPSLPGNYPAFYAAVETALRDGTEPPVTALEAAAALDVIEAARTSARTGKTVEL